MKPHHVFQIVSGVELPPRRYGRTPDINNDDELVKQAVEGYLTGKYKSYAQAAREVAPYSVTYLGKGKKSMVGTIPSIVDRLQRKISKRVCKLRK